MDVQDTIVGESPVFEDQLIIKRYWDGGHREIIEELPGEDDLYDLKETESEVGKPGVEFPRERDHYTVTKYTGYHNGKSRAEYKVFDVQINREEHGEEADRIEGVLQDLRNLPALEEEINEYSSFTELEQNAETVRRYGSLYGVLKRIWEEDSLASYATSDRRARMFEIDQAPQGFYRVPRLFHRHADQLIGDRLDEEDLGTHSVAWGGFLLEPGDFTQVHELLKPFYHTPGKGGN